MSKNWSQDKYINAYRFAAQLHNNQKVPGTDWPYIVHISMVCMELIAALAEEPDTDGDLAVQCALLHDSVEDIEVRYELLKDRVRGELKKELKDKFGQAVLDGVLALTKNDSICVKEDKMKDSLERIKQQPKGIWMVKLADRITNLQKPPDHWESAKKQKYREEAILIHDSLKDARPFLASRLKSKIEEYKSYI